MSCGSVPEPGGRPLTDGTRVITRSPVQPPPAGGRGGQASGAGGEGHPADSPKRPTRGQWDGVSPSKARGAPGRCHSHCPQRELETPPQKERAGASSLGTLWPARGSCLTSGRASPSREPVAESGTCPQWHVTVPQGRRPPGLVTASSRDLPHPKHLSMGDSMAGWWPPWEAVSCTTAAVTSVPVPQFPRLYHGVAGCSSFI